MYKVIEVFIDTNTQVVCISYILNEHLFFRLTPLVPASISRVEFKRLVKRVLEGVRREFSSEVLTNE